MSDDSIEMHGTRKVRTDGESVLVSIPKAALERSGLEVGDQAMVASIEDGPVLLEPWNEEAILSRMDE